MKIKRILSLVLAIALMAVVFVGCGDSTSDNGGDSNGDSAAVEVESNASLKLWGPSATVDLLKRQVKEFQDKYSDKNIKIEVVAQEENDAATNLLNDPTAAADVFAFASNHTEAAVETVKGDYDGKEVIYAFPETDNGYYLVYNKSVVSEKDAKSWEGVLAACEKAGKKFVMDAGNGYYSCMFAFTGGLKLEGLAGEAQDEQKFNDYKEDDVIASMKAFGDLFAKYKKTFSLASVDKVSAGFKDGTCAAGIDGTWNAAVDSEALGKDYGVIKLPTIDINGKATETIGMIGYKYFGVNGQTKYPNAAMELANFLADKDCQQDRFDELGWTPTHKSVKAESSAGTTAMLQEAKTFVVQAAIVQSFWVPFANLGTQLKKDGAKTDEASLKDLLKKTLANING